MDLSALREELLKQHNISLRADDLILVTALFNKRVLTALAAKLAASAENVMNAAAAALARHLEISKSTTERLVTEAAAYLLIHNARWAAAHSEMLDAKNQTFLESLDGRIAVIASWKSDHKPSGICDRPALCALAVALLLMLLHFVLH
jgi:hypothetical protein